MTGNIVGEKNPFYGHKHTEETKQKIREIRLKTKFKTKNTKIEKILQEGLNKNNIKYKKHLTVCDICQPDIVFPEKKIAVFADGDYWHSKTHKDGKAWEKDRNQDKVLSQNGWMVLRFWGHEIKESPQKCVNKIIGVLN